MTAKKPRKALAPAVPDFPLYGEALRAAVGPWKNEVARADVARLDALVGIATTERTRLSDCIRVTFADYPGKPPTPLNERSRWQLSIWRRCSGVPHRQPCPPGESASRCSWPPSL